MFEFQTGIITGSDHKNSNTNRQDALSFVQGVLNGKQYAVGIVADGCGSSSDPEVGAKLAVDFLSKKIVECIANGQTPSSEFNTLKRALVDNMEHLVDQHFGKTQPTLKEKSDFIDQYLLFTLVGFVLHNDNFFFFALGDGAYVIDDEIVIIDQKNQPLFLGYFILGTQHAEKYGVAWEDDKQYRRRVSATQVKKIAIATDGWTKRLAKRQLPHIFEHIKPNSGVQRRMNVLNDPGIPEQITKPVFTDDAAIIVGIWREPEVGWVPTINNQDSALETKPHTVQPEPDQPTFEELVHVSSQPPQTLPEFDLPIDQTVLSQRMKVPFEPLVTTETQVVESTQNPKSKGWFWGLFSREKTEKPKKIKPPKRKQRKP